MNVLSKGHFSSVIAQLDFKNNNWRRTQGLCSPIFFSHCKIHDGFFDFFIMVNIHNIKFTILTIYSRF